jgi:hypothetical protein
MKIIDGGMERGVQEKAKMIIKPKRVERFGLSNTIKLVNDIPKRKGNIST